MFEIDATAVRKRQLPIIDVRTPGECAPVTDALGGLHGVRSR